MTEPRTRTAAEVADHASIVQEDAQRIHSSGAYTTPSATVGQYHNALRLIERLAAQVEDLAAVVDGVVETLEIQADPDTLAAVAEAERLPLTVWCELDPEDDSLTITDYGAGLVGIQARRRSFGGNAITVVLPPAEARRLAHSILAHVGA